MNHDAAQKQAQLLEAQQAQRHHQTLAASSSSSSSLQAQLALSPPVLPHKETIGHGRSWRTLVFLARYVSFFICCCINVNLFRCRSIPCRRCCCTDRVRARAGMVPMDGDVWMDGVV